jgi:amino acid transporter
MSDFFLAPYRSSVDTGIANATLGPALGAMMTWTVVVAAVVALIPICASVARLMYAMGRDGQLPNALGRIHSRHGTPQDFQVNSP